METLKTVRACFERIYHKSPSIYRSPARVNLIGEHTDYNHGYVLPAAVSKAIYFAISPNTTGEYNFYALDMEEAFQTEVGHIGKSSLHWANYLLGVIDQLSKRGTTPEGFDCVFGGDIPMGAGMSSSAALECGLAFALNDLFQFNYSRMALVNMAQEAEHEYAGVQCGIMDQFAVMFGIEGQAIQLDCQSMEHEYVPLDMHEHTLVLVNTGVKHSLASSEYNKRRQECANGIQQIRKYYPFVETMRDVTIEMMEKLQHHFAENVYQRCKYVIQENERLLKACEYLKAKDLKGFGRMMYASHQGLDQQYEVSCPELNQLVSIAQQTAGVLGARMMGGGFGGCTVNLIENAAVKAFEQSVLRQYKTPEGAAPQLIEVIIDNGTRKIQ